ncbi:FkbM family methyltransferase [Tumidithrix elongata RA019]|uniref:FkbM family methyltransferase n=1 Tax=Tumidithrix elongata BACA0141 TaxID=2716417 RepID=A0AAW9PW44_9CYAN|nr:FkbM family methyltransferase [Tumidithrix elongata RA019]
MCDQLPLVSIGLPVYNGEKFVRQSLDSLVTQSYPCFELIISDNASTDLTQEICLEYAAKYPQIKYFRNLNNLGATYNFNHVLELSTGEYFMWASCDDLWEPSYVSTMVDLLHTTPKAVLAFSTLDSITYENGDFVKAYPDILEIPSEAPYQRLSNYINQEEFLGKANFIHGLMRVNAIHSIEGIKLWGKGHLGADMLIVFRLLSLGNFVVSKDLLFHKRHGGSSDPSEQSHQWGKSKLADLQQVSLSIKDWYGYFYGYAHIIDLTNLLTIKEKAKLKFMVLKRFGQICWRQIKPVLITPIAIKARSILDRAISKSKQILKPKHLDSLSKTSKTSTLLEQNILGQKVSYAQCGEDLIVDFLFSCELKKSNFTYLDIGSYHPTQLSNTYLFYQKGCRGVCVEPDPTLFNEIKKLREEDICLNVGIGVDRNTQADFYIMTARTLNTFSKVEAERYASFGSFKIEEVIQVPLININELIHQHFPNCPNFISIDIEGLDFEVLKTFDFSRFRPEVFCVETKTYAEDKTERKLYEIIELMNSKGYFVYADTYINSIFVDKEAWKNRQSVT